MSNRLRQLTIPAFVASSALITALLVVSGPAEGNHACPQNGQNNFCVGHDIGENIDVAGGYDVVVARGGSDVVRGGSEQDQLHGEEGNDDLHGGIHDDCGALYFLASGGGNDTLDGGDGADCLDGGFGNDTMHGGVGPDFLYGDGDSGAPDFLIGGPGSDTCVAGQNDTIDASCLP